MIKTIKKLFFIVLTLIFVSGVLNSCKKENGIAPDIGYNYYPTTTGWFIEYEIDSIVYNDFTNTIDTTHYYLKEIIESEFKNAAETPSFRIERYKRKNLNEDWTISDVWFVYKSNTNVIRVEENVHFVKLIFPVKNGSRWNGNNFNSLGEQYYEFSNKDEVFKIGSLTFDSSVVVKQFENINLIENQEFKEVYARNIGLIYKEMIDLKTEVNGTIKKGYRFYQKIISYGKN